jgi:hypothetical protein
LAIYSQQTNNLMNETVTGTQPFISLLVASAVQNGSVLNTGAAHSNHTMVVTSSAGVSAGSVQLQGSLDGVSWFNMGTAVSTTTGSTVFTPVVVTGDCSVENGLDAWCPQADWGYRTMLSGDAVVPPKAAVPMGVPSPVGPS